MTIDDRMQRAQLGWIIDVCAECGRLAVWPFCEHRSSTEKWTVGIAVKPTQAGRRMLLMPPTRLDAGPASGQAQSDRQR